jgi:large subunit ribosomal protein L25
MSANKFELTAELREDVGRGASRRLRNENKVPAIIYGASEPAVSLTLNHDHVINALANEAFYSHILTLKTNKNSEKVILKDVQRDPSKPRVLHMDFLRVKADQELHMHIPLHFIGEDKAPGLKEGGAFSHLMNDVEVVCLPADLPEYIEVDVSQLALDQTVHLSELKLPKGLRLAAFAHGVEGHDLPVITIHIPRIIEEEVPVEAAPTEEGAAPVEGTESQPADQKTTESPEK